MKKICLLLVVLISLSYGQFEANDLTNSTLTTDTDWGKGAGWAIGSGVATHTPPTTVSSLYQTGTVILNTTYRVKWEITAITAGSFFVRCGAFNPSSDRSTAGIYVEELTSGETGTTFNVYSSLDGDGSVDNLYLYKQIDTLWVFTTGADTDDDTTLTLTESFVTRGAHSGGTFITEPGTWDESITIDSSFALWTTATPGDSVIVTAVDFGGVTATLLDVYITTPTNDSNTTYTYTPAATTTTRKRNFYGWGKYGGWLK